LHYTVFVSQYQWWVLLGFIRFCQVLGIFLGFLDFCKKARPGGFWDFCGFSVIAVDTVK